PIQGEAGIVVPPQNYLADLRRICTQHGILLIFDEVQSGFGRTGRMFAFEHEDAQPDGLIVGKALGGGLLPVSAFVARREVMDVFDPGSHGSTFGGNPLAMAVAVEAMQVLKEEDLVARSAAQGKILHEALAEVSHPAIREVRGKGLWIGVEIDPRQLAAKDLCIAMGHRGVLTKETHETVIRFAPPLTIETADLLAAVDVFAAALDDCAPQTKARRGGSAM
ncbi:MAG: aspartate aminotransferase family protein, partial [Bradyrhizobium sp.]